MSTIFIHALIKGLKYALRTDRYIIIIEGFRLFKKGVFLIKAIKHTN